MAHRNTGIRPLASQLTDDRDLFGLVTAARSRRFVAIGEASHGTSEFYEWRARLTRLLIELQDVAFIGVEGDWPDCWRIDRWVRGIADQDLDARGVLAGFERWPTWMWANAEVADFLEWLRGWNLSRADDQRVGFLGLDVYSLWDSLERIIRWLEIHDSAAVPAALRAWQCFSPYHEDPHLYAWSTRLVPATCETDVVDLLVEVRRAAAADGDDAFDAEQNAATAVEAERYYRAMVRTDRRSWNIRDTHMADTVDRIARHAGTGSRGIIWAHNTHIGDARATSMRAEGLTNIGQLLRERYGRDQVMLVGAASHRGEVVAGRAWGGPAERMPVPAARPGTHESILHETLGEPAVIDLSRPEPSGWREQSLGHRAIGVVYDPARESGNYVPTVMGERYDALLWFEHTSALTPLQSERQPAEPEYEAEPTGF